MAETYFYTGLSTHLISSLNAQCTPYCTHSSSSWSSFWCGSANWQSWPQDWGQLVHGNVIYYYYFLSCLFFITFWIRHIVCSRGPTVKCHEIFLSHLFYYFRQHLIYDYSRQLCLSQLNVSRPYMHFHGQHMSRFTRLYDIVFMPILLCALSTFLDPKDIKSNTIDVVELPRFIWKLHSADTSNQKGRQHRSQCLYTKLSISITYKLQKLCLICNDLQMWICVHLE